MPRQPAKRSTRILGLVLLCLIAAAAAVWLRQAGRTPAPPPGATGAGPGATAPEPQAATGPRPPEAMTVIGRRAMEEDGDLQDLVEERKTRFGIDKGVDFIAGSDEAIEVGGITVPMAEILEKIRLKRGEILESDIGADSGRAGVGAGPDAPVELYGIYLVRPGDNIWNIHFTFLKELFAGKGVALARRADEPTGGGRSSGIGKLLKFSEDMVAIYNLREGRIEPDLNVIVPESKVMVFNFSRVFSMLDPIDYKNIDRIQFDGETLWVPAAR